MTQAGVHPDVIFFLIAIGWVALKFFSSLKEQKAKDRERAAAEKAAARAPKPVAHAPKRAAADEEWKPFESFPDADAADTPTARPAPQPRVAARPAAAPPVLRAPNPVRPKLVAVMTAKAREMQAAPAPHATVAEVQPAEMPVLPTGAVADGHMPAAVPTSTAPVAGAEKVQARAFKVIPRSRSTAFRRRIVIDVRHPVSLRQAIVLSEILGRPRAFDV